MYQQMQMDQDIDEVLQMDLNINNVTLSESDIDGAALAGRHPKKLTKQELKFWLDCRAIGHTKLKTKAELVSRVLEVSETDVGVVDPTPDLLYTKRKFELSSRDTTDCKQGKNGEPVSAPISIQLPTSNWQKVIPPGMSFNDIYINDYVLNSGKRAFKTDLNQPRKKTCIRPETKGYRFFTEKYLFGIWCASANEHIYFKSKCFPSQRKNNQPHNIWCAIKKITFTVDIGQCTCIAGKSGYCNHLMALLYQISHFTKSATTIIPDDLTKTSMPMTWQKPRIEGVTAEPIMEVVVHPTYTNREFKSTLYEARAPAALPNDCDLLTRVQETLAMENSKLGICMARNQARDTAICCTQLGTWVPVGSPLSYQLALTEGDFHVECNVASLDKFKCKQSCDVRDMACYPDMPMCPTQPPYIEAVLATEKGEDILKMLAVDSDTSQALEMETRDQAGSDKWWEERRLRITASKFGEVVSRKQRNFEKFVERLQSRSDMNARKIPMSLRHGRDYENVAKRKYQKYMTNIGHKVEIRPSGLVVREDYPHLGASPDGKVLDPVAHPHFGILEVKCPHKYRSVKPREAAAIDKDFCLGTHRHGDMKLRESHHYFCQVQGQMLLTGAQWCDFVVYTFKGLHIERIPFDRMFCDNMLHQLNHFYFSNYLAHAKV